MGTEFKDVNGNRVGYISETDIKDTYGNRVGYKTGTDIKDTYGNRVGYDGSSDIKDTYGNRVGYINGNEIRDTNGNRVGYAVENATKEEMVAAALLLFKLHTKVQKEQLQVDVPKAPDAEKELSNYTSNYDNTYGSTNEGIHNYGNDHSETKTYNENIPINIPSDTERLLYEAVFARGNDNAKAAAIFERLVALNHCQAMGALGDMLIKGEGVQKDYARGIQLLTKAVELGDELSIVVLGQCYYKGEAIERDLDKANELFRRAERSSCGIRLFLAHQFRNGNDAPKDIAKAIEIYMDLSSYADNDSVMRVAADCIKKLKSLPEAKEPFRQYEYNKLVQEKKAASTEDAFRSLAGKFRMMKDFCKSAELANECEKQYEALKELRKQSPEYKKSIALSLCSNNSNCQFCILGDPVDGKGNFWCNHYQKTYYVKMSMDQDRINKFNEENKEKIAKQMATDQRIKEESRIRKEERKLFLEKINGWQQQGLCIYCGGEVNGIFKKKCKSCGKTFKWNVKLQKP